MSIRELYSCSCYIHKDTTSTHIYNDFIRQVRSGLHGLYITRSTPSLNKAIVHSHNLSVVLLQKKSTDDCMVIYTIADFINLVVSFSFEDKKSVILLDRIDYLINKYSFEDFINAIYDIHDIINNMDSIFIVHVNPATLNKRQLAILDDELKCYPTIEMVTSKPMNPVDDLLLFVTEEEERKGFVYFKQIIHNMCLTYPTIRKRLSILEEKGLVVIHKYGRFKRIFITEKGNRFLKMRLNGTSRKSM